MATYTTNYNLEKPAQTDIYNVDVFNANADKIDAGLTDKAEKTMLAPVETTNSASRSYAKGEYFVYNNVLCCATTAIAAGGTIAIGTNCATAPVGGELKSLRDALTPTNLSPQLVMYVTYTTRYLVKIGHIVIFEMVIPSAASGITKVCTIPAEACPAMAVALSVSRGISTDRVGVCEGLTGTSGDLYIHLGSAASGAVNITGCWYVL